MNTWGFIEKNLMRYKESDLLKLHPNHPFRKAWEAQAGNRAPVPAANSKPDPGNGLQGKAENKEAHEAAYIQGPVRLRFQNFRKGIARVDRVSGLWEKWVTDSFVTAGVIPDDNPTFVPEAATHEYIESETEKTIIIIEEI